MRVIEIHYGLPAGPIGTITIEGEYLNLVPPLDIETAAECLVPGSCEVLLTRMYEKSDGVKKD